MAFPLLRKSFWPWSEQLFRFFLTLFVFCRSQKPSLAEWFAAAIQLHILLYRGEEFRYLLDAKLGPTMSISRKYSKSVAAFSINNFELRSDEPGTQQVSVFTVQTIIWFGYVQVIVGVWFPFVAFVRIILLYAICPGTCRKKLWCCFGTFYIRPRIPAPSVLCAQYSGISLCQTGKS